MCPPDRIPTFTAGMLEEWAAFFSRHPCICEAVTAAATGEAVEVLSVEHGPYRRRLFVRDRLPWQEDTFYLDMDLREAVLTGYLNHRPQRGPGAPPRPPPPA